MPQAAPVPGLPRLSDVRQLTKLSLSTDLSPADWIVASLTDFAKSVNSIVPRGFPAYVRVFHHAHKREEDDIVHVRWCDIAAANGRAAHAGMQLCALTGSESAEEDAQPGVFDMPPRGGSIPRSLIPPLLEALARHTATPERCWFAVWVGWGGLRPELRYVNAFETPGREYFLLEGPIECAMENLNEYPSTQSANIWWPHDHAWCVVTEIDLKTTYIGCAEACRDDLLARPKLEAHEIDPSYGIDGRSDKLNPL